MSSDEEDGVKLYNSLERKLKRPQTFVSLSSSDEDEDSDDYDAYDASFASPAKKKLRGGRGNTVTPSPARAAQTVAVDEEEDDDQVKLVFGDDLLTAKEKAMERERELRLEKEIAERLAKDTLLNRTRAIMYQVQIQSMNGAIELDSDEDDFQILPSPRQTTTAVAPVAVAPTMESKGDRLTLQVRSNGSKVDEITMFSNESFSLLYERFCDLHGLPRSAVQMTLDGESLELASNPNKADLESGDLIDAKVDFSKADTLKKKSLVRLRLVVARMKTVVFVIDSTSPMAKLHTSFCNKLQVPDPDDVDMTVRGEPIRFNDTIEAHELYDDDEINVEMRNYFDPDAIELRVRFDDKLTRPHSVVLTQKVEVLIAQVASHLNTPVGRVSLRLDGEGMDPNQTFQAYDLEGGELVEVRLRH